MPLRPGALAELAELSRSVKILVLIDHEQHIDILERFHQLQSPSRRRIWDAFIKIDVEGMEPKVLRGAEQTIARHQPIIAMEQHRDDFRGGGSASVAWLTERGYRFCWYEGRPETSKLAKGLYDLREAFLGVEDRIVYGDEVPVRAAATRVAFGGAPFTVVALRSLRAEDEDTCRVSASWRGHDLAITIQGASEAPAHPTTEVPK